MASHVSDQLNTVVTLFIDFYNNQQTQPTTTIGDLFFFLFLFSSFYPKINSFHQALLSFPFSFICLLYWNKKKTASFFGYNQLVLVSDQAKIMFYCTQLDQWCTSDSEIVKFSKREPFDPKFLKFREESEREQKLLVRNCPLIQKFRKDCSIPTTQSDGILDCRKSVHSPWPAVGKRPSGILEIETMEL